MCDLPAACHAAGLAGVSSHFLCSTCNHYHKSSYGRVDYMNWTPHDKDELQMYAEQWRDAATTADCDHIFKTHGIQYLELWHLPYWDPTHQLVVDSMHCILEGLVQHHCCNLLGLTMTSTHSEQARPAFEYDFVGVDPEITTPQFLSMKEFSQVSAIHNLLVAEVPNSSSPPCVNAFMDKLLQSLLHKNLAALKFVCNSLDCNPVHEGRLSKYNYAEMLVAWVSCLVIHYPSISHLHIQCQDMLLSVMPQLDTDLDAHKVLQCIHAVICDASMPSWLGSVPASFGDAAAGTIKADKWCSLIMVYIPITLISLWGSSQV